MPSHPSSSEFYKSAVYSNLLTGIVYGEEQLLVQFISHCALHMITGAYILVYVTSVYVLL
jgi:hypothetical protein